jgi:hypothetical protein
MSLTLTPDSISLSKLSDISYPLVPTYRTYTTTISPNTPNLSLTPTSMSIKTEMSPPYTTSLNTFNSLNLSQLSQLSPMSQMSQMSPFSPLSTVSTTLLNVNPNALSMLAVKPTVYVDIDTGLNDSYVVQKDVTKYFMYKALDKWIYNDFPSVLKYLVYKDGKVSLIKKLSDKENNEVSKDSEKALEAKADFIEDKILNESRTREILIRIMRELGLKWFELPYREGLVKEVMERFLKKKLKKMVSGEKDD